jgi:hypothetical protein
MSIVPEIERQLCLAAERRARRPAVRAVNRVRRLRSALLTRPPLIALGMLLIAAGVALAAKTLIGIGSPVPRTYPDLGQVIMPQGTRLLSLRVPDPAGGPPWGLRIIFTAGEHASAKTRADSRAKEPARWGCVQAGRVVDDELGVIGQDGAFHNDHLFHELPLQPEACGSLNRHGALVGLTGGSNIETASAYQGFEGCVTAPSRRLQQMALPIIKRELAIARAEHDAHAIEGARENLSSYRRIDPRVRAEPDCPAKDLRHIAFGIAGPEARSVTLNGHGIHETIPLNPRDDGAYMIIQRVSLREGIQAVLRKENLTLSALATHATVHYENGRSCPGPNSTPSCLAPLGSVHTERRRPSGTPTTSGPPHRTLAPGPETARSRRAEHDPGTPNPVTVTPAAGGPHTAFTLSFTALLNGGGYSYLIESDGSKRCRREAERATGGDGVAIGITPLVRGQRIVKALMPPPHGLCPGSYRIYVTFSDPEPGSLPSFPFATVRFAVHR